MEEPSGEVEFKHVLHGARAGGMEEAATEMVETRRGRRSLRVTASVVR